MSTAATLEILNRAARPTIEEVGQVKPETKRSKTKRAALIPEVGTVLKKKTRGGLSAKCTVEKDGFRYRGKLFPTLTAAAMAAAPALKLKSKQNGFVFWGLA